MKQGTYIYWISIAYPDRCAKPFSRPGKAGLLPAQAPDQVDFTLTAEGMQRFDGGFGVLFGITGEICENEGGEIGPGRGAPFLRGPFSSGIEPELFGAGLMSIYGPADQGDTFGQRRHGVGRLKNSDKVFGEALLNKFGKANKGIFHKHLG